MKHRLRRKNRWVPILLCCAILISMVVPFVSFVFARENKVEVTLEGEVIDRCSIKEDEKVTLTAAPSGFDAVQYQWQILLDSSLSLWVNIADKTAEDCEVSVALLNTLLDESNCAYLRCAVTGDEGQVYSDSVCVLVLPAPEPELQSTADEQIASIVADPMQMRSIANTYKAANAVVLNSGSGDEEDDDDDDSYATITIKYLYSNSPGGTEFSAFTPYVATVEKGLPFHQSVVSPTILGFAPFLDENKNGVKDTGESAATSVPLDYDAVTESQVFHVVYEAIEVPYAIRYFFQNVSDDDYTERGFYDGRAVTGTVITDAMIAAHQGDITGFTSLYHVPQDVAADGSTVFECYFDRNYYLIQFDLVGGYGVDPIYARYETTVVIPDPIQAGYRFGGWELVSIDGTAIENWVGPLPDGVSATSVPTSVPAHNLVYQAKWVAGESSYTTAYWIKRGNGSYEYIDSTTTSGVLSGSDISYGDTLRDDVLICGLTEHTHKPTCYENCTHLCLLCYVTEAQANSLKTCDEIVDTPGVACRSAFLEMRERGYPTPEKTINGNVYKYKRSGLFTRWFNFFYLNGIWYYLGYGVDYSSVRLDGSLSNSEPGQEPTQVAADPQYQNSGHHTHSESCTSCGKIEHSSHDANCRLRSYYEYDSASTVAANTHEEEDEDGSTTVVTNKVAGDGSTVVNVYYKPKTYTLRFYYAAEEQNGTAEIIGGSTYPFGHLNYATEDDILLLDHEFDAQKNGIAHVNVGAVSALPALNEKGIGRSYRKDFEYSASSGRKYYYIEFSAEYGQDISNLWPIDVFQPATRLNKENPPWNGWPGDKAFVSAWNGEYYVRYSVLHSSASGGNETIKGKQVSLDSTLLFDMEAAPTDVKNKRLVSFLCFWENGNGNSSTDWNVPNLFIYNIWVPVQVGDTNPEGYPVTTGSDSKLYKRIDSYPTCDNSSKSDKTPYAENQTEPTLVGYKAKARVGREASVDDLDGIQNLSDYKEKYVIDFFYEPLTYPMGVYNYGELVGSNDAVAFGSKFSYVVEDSVQLETGSFTPVYPASLEPDAFEFKGWYSTENFIPGTEVDLANGIMPSHGLMVYAKWELVQHTVNYFASYNDLLTYQEEPDGGWGEHDWGEDESDSHWMKSVSVPHGSDVTTAVPDPNPEHSDPFKGWFYIDENGDKKKLESQNMPITRDLNVFAERHTNSTVPYVIHYVYQDPETHEDTYIAADTTGEAFLNSTCTFTAKAGDQLYSAYQTNYYPKLRSHSINMDTGVNEFTFEYVTVTGTPKYRVQYRDRLNLPIPNPDSPGSNYVDVTRDAASAVARERFLSIPDMVPDAFYKKLVLQAEQKDGAWVVLPEHNVITFYYTPNSDIAFYGVHYMLEKLDATDADRGNYAIDGSGGYEQTGTMIEGVGNIADGYASIPPQVFPGFELITSPKPKVVRSNGSETEATTNAGGEYQLPIEANGTELYVFYRRKSYPYYIRYYLYNTTTDVSTPYDSGEADKRRFGSTVTASAPDFENYTLVSPETQSTKSLTINVVETEADRQRNTIVFYYTPSQYIAEYVVVGGEGGQLSSTIEVKNGSEQFSGSTPTAKANYEFEGWYLDEECTSPVTDDEGTVDADTKKLVPNKTNMASGERYQFYAKFVKRAGNLTITRSGAEADQVFVYKVQNTTTGAVYYVTVTGNGSATIHDLPMGTYYVTQQKDWSWRYDEHDADVTYKSVTHDDLLTTVSFTDAAQTDQWVNGNSAVRENVRGS